MSLKNTPTELIERCRNGDETAFNELFDLIGMDLYRWIYSIVHNSDDAEEVLQEIYVRIFRHIGKLKDVSKFQAWIGRLLINQCNTFLKHRGRHMSYALNEAIGSNEEQLPLQGTPQTSSPRDALARKELLRTILQAIQMLPPKQRLAIQLFEVEGYSIKEVAELLDSTEGAIKFNLHEGRKKLRKFLKPFLPDHDHSSLLADD
ncbi:MAG: sigma-70 family RNA polymerase sigma factor [Candidatus Sumerlaeia bacterium]